MERIEEMTPEELNADASRDDLRASLSDAIALGDQHDIERLHALRARLKVAARLSEMITPSGSGRALDYAAQERGVR